jgi:hypothetical protein
MANGKSSWVSSLSEEDLEFVKNFVLKSGSLKDMAEAYGVSYPTMRLKLDKLIEKIGLVDNNRDDDYTRKIKAMAIDGKLSLEAARELIEAYRLKGE